MGIETSGGAPPTALGGAAREVGNHWNGSIQQSAGFDEWTNLAGREAMARYGTQAPALSAGGGGPQWENGASGGAGNRGKGSQYFMGMRAAFIGVAATLTAPVPNDFYSRVRVNVLTERPVNLLNYPFHAWRLRVLMGLKAGVAGTIIDDCGIVLLANSGITAYAGGFTPNAANNQPGFSVSFQGAGGANLVWRSRAAAAGGLNETVVLAQTAVNRIEQVDILMVSATPSADARVVVSVNGAPLLSRAWGVGTVLPNRTSFATWGGTLTPFIRNCDAVNNGNFDLMVPHIELAAAASEDLLR